MFYNTNGSLDLVGYSGQTYRFNLYTFETFDDLKNVFRSGTPALYLFTRRGMSANGFSHDLIYLGETGDLSTRFSNHHKELCIMKNGANCIGIYVASVSEKDRKTEEKDLLFNYDFPCNIQDN